MAYVINQDICEACGECLPICPSEAILESEGTYTIDEENCVDCGVCVDTCPTGAISEKEQ